MPKIIIMKGLPAAGKSEKCKELLAHGNTVRINKDLLRTMLHHDKFSYGNEDKTLQAAIKLVAHFLTHDVNVIVDDTNLNPKTVGVWVDLAETIGAKIEYSDLTDVPVDVCIERDLHREKKVGWMVIKKMALRWLRHMEGEKVVICDLDGTLCNIDHRLKYGSGAEKDWGKFFAGISGDTLRHDVFNRLVELKNLGNKIIFVSARTENYRNETEEWLSNNFSYNAHLSSGTDYHPSVTTLPYHGLIMREANDKRDDAVVKREIYDKYLKHLNIVKVFDDRPKVIRMWRELGLDVEDVGNGIEF